MNKAFFNSNFSVYSLLKKALIPLLVFFFYSAPASAESLAFNCGTNPLNSLTQCSTSQKAPTDIILLATAVYDVINPDTTLPLPATPCTTDTFGTNCIIGDSGNGFPINLQCSTGAGTIACTLPGDLADAMKITCNTGGFFNGCAYTSNKLIFWQVLLENATGSFTDNEAKITESLMNCMAKDLEVSDMHFACDRLVSLISNGNYDGVKQLIAAITPRKSDMSLDMSANVMNSSIADVKSRLQKLRSGTTGNGLSLKIFDGQQWHDAYTQLASSTASTTDTEPQAGTNISEYGKFGVFLNATAIQSEQDAIDDEDGHEASNNTITTGFDYRFSANNIAGLALSFSQNLVDYDSNTGELDSSSVTLIAYNSYYINDWFIDTDLSIGSDSYDQERTIICPAILCGTTHLQTFEADYDGQQIALSISSGYEWRQDALIITPFAHLTMAELKTDAYEEDATNKAQPVSSMFGQAMDEQTRDLLTLKAGANFQYIFTTEHGVFVPLVSVHAVHEFEDSDQLVTGSFIGNVGSSEDSDFSIEVTQGDTSYWVLGTGLTFQLKNGNAGFINIQSTQGYEGLSQTQYTFGWRWEI